VAERQPSGRWANHPQYQCRWCQFDRLDHPDDVEAHEQRAHPDEYIRALYAADAAAAPATTTEPSGPQAAQEE
jgi:hypothetical protein